MSKKTALILAVVMLTGGSAMAANAPITGNVQSKCSVQTVRQGVFGQPTPDKLSTSGAGGVEPKIRYDVALADNYIARITHPDSFSSSPSLTDTVTWVGETSVAEVTDPGMSAYDASKIEYNNVTEFDLTIAGSVWFKVSSTASYGYNKPLPGGNYTAVVVAECIAK